MGWRRTADRTPEPRPAAKWKAGRRKCQLGWLSRSIEGLEDALDFESAVREPSDIAALGNLLVECRRCVLGVLRRARGRVLV
jgi:hypothetical protein